MRSECHKYNKLYLLDSDAEPASTTFAEVKKWCSGPTRYITRTWAVPKPENMIRLSPRAGNSVLFQIIEIASKKALETFYQPQGKNLSLQQGERAI